MSSFLGVEFVESKKYSSHNSSSVILTVFRQNAKIFSSNISRLKWTIDFFLCVSIVKAMSSCQIKERIKYLHILTDKIKYLHILTDKIKYLHIRTLIGKGFQEGFGWLKRKETARMLKLFFYKKEFHSYWLKGSK